jgi:uncharacterized membrane protein YcfT
VALIDGSSVTPKQLAIFGVAFLSGGILLSISAGMGFEVAFVNQPSYQGHLELVSAIALVVAMIAAALGNLLIRKARKQSASKS